MSATNFNEPPCAEPHAGGCGGWELVTPGYPIRGDVTESLEAFLNNMN
jgi:hypothetical protein